MKHGTVCFIVKDGKVLLAHIKHLDGRLLWNGIGGVVDDGETPVDAVIREMQEETELQVIADDLKEALVVMVNDMPLHVFTANSWSGEQIALDPTIVELKWFDITEVPYAETHEGNDRWLPSVLAGAAKLE